MFGKPKQFRVFALVVILSVTLLAVQPSKPFPTCIVEPYPPPSAGLIEIYKRFGFDLKYLTGQYRVQNVDGELWIRMPADSIPFPTGIKWYNWDRTAFGYVPLERVAGGLGVRLSPEVFPVGWVSFTILMGGTARIPVCDIPGEIISR